MTSVKVEYFRDRLCDLRQLNRAFVVILERGKRTELIVPPGGRRRLGLVSNLRIPQVEKVVREISDRRISLKVVPEGSGYFTVIYGSPRGLDTYFAETAQLTASKFGQMLGYKRSAIRQFQLRARIHRQLLSERFSDKLRKGNMGHWIAKVNREIYRRMGAM